MNARGVSSLFHDHFGYFVFLYGCRRFDRSGPSAIDFAFELGRINSPWNTEFDDLLFGAEEDKGNLRRRFTDHDIAILFAGRFELEFQARLDWLPLERRAKTTMPSSYLASKQNKCFAPRTKSWLSAAAGVASTPSFRSFVATNLSLSESSMTTMTPSRAVR